MEELLNQFKVMVDQLRTKANEVLVKLPPLEQFEANSSIAHSIRDMEYMGKYFEESFQSALEKVTELQGKFPAKVEEIETAAVEAALKDGEVMKKEDVEASIQAAKANAEKQVREEVTLLASRRAELIAKPENGEALLSAEMAALIPDEVLLGETYKDAAKMLSDRVDNMVKIGLKTPSLQASLAKEPLDEDGQKVFKSRLESIVEVSGGIPSGASPVASPFAGAVKTNEEEIVGF